MKMISSGLEKSFSLIWALVKLNLIFLSFTLLGGIIFGIGPALQMLSDLIQVEGLDYQAQTWSAAYERFKANFVKGNLHFYFFCTLFGLVSYSLYLATQLQGFLWLLVDFSLLFLLLFLAVFYLFILLNEAAYDLLFTDLLKLSFIRVFMDFGVFMKLLIGLVGIFLVTWQMKGLLVFATFSLSLFWVNSVSRKTQAMIDGMLAHEE